MLYRRRRAYVKPAASAADRFSLSTTSLGHYQEVGFCKFSIWPEKGAL